MAIFNQNREALRVTPGHEARVFLSYASEDRERVSELYDRLKSDGYSPWMDAKDLLPGQHWKNHVEAAIRKSSAVVVCLSKSSVGRTGTIQRELKIALDVQKEKPEGQIFLIPALLEPAEIPDPLHEIQAVDLEAQDGYLRLVEALQFLTGQSASARGISPKRNLTIDRVVLSNIGCFEDFELELEAAGRPVLWTMVLGDNAAGKSTLLRSLALGLCNESDAVALIKALPGSFVRRGSEEGLIELHLRDTVSGEKLVITTRIIRAGETDERVRKSTSPEAEFPWSDVFVCGYGTQRSKRAHSSFDRYSIRNAVESLFNDDASLQNPELMLLRQPPDLRSRIERKVLEILMLSPEGFRFAYSRSGPEIRGPWGEQPLQFLSDGYRSTTQWLLDFVSWLIYGDRFNGNDEVGGILLIDEIEQHLHPRWQRHIIQRLRRQFPATQIVASTHTPLVTVGIVDIDDSLLVRLQLDDDGTVGKRLIDERSIAGLRADQVLTSEAFGLVTSRNPGSETDLHRYAELLARPDRSTAENTELEKLSEHLGSVLQFGENPFERQVESAVAKTLKKMVLSADPKLLELETKNQLREIFRAKERE